MIKFPLNEDEQKRYDAPFVAGEISVRLPKSKKRQNVSGESLGSYGVFQAGGYHIAYLANGEIVASGITEANAAKAIARALFVTWGWGYLPLFSATFEAMFYDQIRLLKEEVLKDIVFDKEGRVDVTTAG